MILYVENPKHSKILELINKLFSLQDIIAIKISVVFLYTSNGLAEKTMNNFIHSSFKNDKILRHKFKIRKTTKLKKRNRRHKQLGKKPVVLAWKK